MTYSFTLISKTASPAGVPVSTKWSGQTLTAKIGETTVTVTGDNVAKRATFNFSGLSEQYVNQAYEISYLDNGVKKIAQSGFIYDGRPGEFTSTTPGPTGPQGIQGVQGIKGDKGDTGSAGSNGTNGTNGAKGDQGIQGVKGDKGDQGIQGVKGDTGASGTGGGTSTNRYYSTSTNSWPSRSAGVDPVMWISTPAPNAVKPPEMAVYDMWFRGIEETA